MNEQKQTNEEQVNEEQVKEQAQVNEQEKVYVQPRPKPIKSWVKIIIMIVVLVATLIVTWFVMYVLVNVVYEVPDEKPVIYLYPTQKQDVQVKLDYKGEIFADYPEYNEEIKGWKVLAYPDGKLINYADDKEYSYLFWEGNPSKKIDYDLSSGFVVKGADTKEFLQKTLSQMGLTPKEYNEFIVYWFPKMQDNAYNLIHFAHEKYTDSAPLTIAPKPDSMLRVFMVFKPLEKPVEIKEQKLEHFERKGFSVVEWGGTEVK